MSVANLLKNSADAGVFLYVEDKELRFKLTVSQFPEKIKAEILHYKQEIIKFLSELEDEGVDLLDSEITPAKRDNETFPLSFEQQRFWFMDQLEGGSAHYNMLYPIQIKGDFNLEFAEQVLTSIVARHEILRTTYHWVGERVVQKVNPPTPFKIKEVSLIHLPPEEQRKELKRLIDEDSALIFNLSEDLMLRATWMLLEKASGQMRGVLLLNMHHIATDEQSHEVLNDELISGYWALINNKAVGIAPLKYQYADYAVWQRDNITHNVLKKEIGYWKKYLDGIAYLHSLPTDYPRPKIQSFRGKSYALSLDGNVERKLKDKCLEYDVTPYIFLQTVYALLLSRYCNMGEVVIGSPYNARNRESMHPLVGCFLNNVLIRNIFNEESSFLEILLTNKNNIVECFANTLVPYDMIVAELGHSRSLSYSPVNQLRFSFFDKSSPKEYKGSLTGVELSTIPIETTYAKFDLILNAVLLEDGIELTWIYNSDIFKESTIIQLANSFEVLLNSTLLHTERKVLELDYLSSQQMTLLEKWSQPRHSVGVIENIPTESIMENFEKQVSEQANAIALSFGSQEYTFAELNEKINQLANLIDSWFIHKNRKGKPIALLLERGLNTVVAILAALKTNKPYIPIDVNNPKERIELILDDAHVGLIITQINSKDKLADYNNDCFILDGDGFVQDLTGLPADRCKSSHQASAPAYIIYTSGSTGRPKGVVVSHDNLNNFSQVFKQQILALGVEENSSWLWNSSYAFDASLKGIIALSHGRRIIITTEVQSKDPDALLDLIKRNEIDVLNLPPAMMVHMVPTLLENAIATNLIVSGDVVNNELWVMMSNYCHTMKTQAINAYGPTEATVNASFSMISDSVLENIGYPVINCKAYVLSHTLHPIPVGAIGELYIAGRSVALGYLNQPELTESTFVSSPFDSADRLYRTGDLVRFGANGELYFIGRADHQVKIRGFRIELGEIDNCIQQCVDVENSVALAFGEGVKKQLLAYIQPKNIEAGIDESELVSVLSKQLPDYMLPSQYIIVDKMPLTPGGKIDNSALLRIIPAEHHSKNNTENSSATEQKNSVKNRLKMIWLELLNREDCADEDNFFMLGGHSILALSMIAEIDKEFGVTVGITDLYANLQLMDLAVQIESLLESDVDEDKFVVPENLIPEKCKYITPNMLPLVQLTQQEIDDVIKKIPGGASNVQDIYPLAPLQEGVLFIHHISENRDPYVLLLLHEFADKKSLEYFISCINFVIQRHDVLRTAVLWRNREKALQLVYREVELPVEYLNFDDAEDIHEAFLDFVEKGAHRIELEAAPLIQLQVAEDKLSGKIYTLLKNHHLISDHISLDIIMEEVEAFQKGQVNALSTPIPYREFVAHTLHHNATLNAEAFFTKQLGDVKEPTLPFGLNNVTGDGRGIEELHVGIGDEVSRRIRQVMRQQKQSPANFFHAAWAMLLSACTGHDDVVFATVLSGRSHGDKNILRGLGMMINTLPIRVVFNDLNAVEVIKQVSATLQSLIPYEQASLAQAQHCSGLGGSVPLFSALFNYRHNGAVKVSEKELDDSAAENKAPTEVAMRQLVAQERLNYPFVLSVNDSGGNVEFSLSLQIDRKVDINPIATYMQTAILSLLDALAYGSKTPVVKLPVLPEFEQHHLAYDLNDTAMDYPKDKCIHEHFEQQAEENPDNVAVVFGDKQLTYKELNQVSNQLAYYLREQGVETETLLGICVERSLEMIIGILGILKAGAAYVPLDPTYPQERLNYMLEDAALSVVLSQSQVQEVLVNFSGTLLVLDNLGEKNNSNSFCDQYPKVNLTASETRLTSSHLAYVIYTSGSTGKPKGVLVEHRSITNYLSNVKTYAHDLINCSVLTTSLNFDATVTSLFSAWLHGGYLRVIPETDDIFSDLLALMKSEESALFKITPSHLQGIELDETIENRHVFIVGGEAFSYDLAHNISAKMPNSYFVNEYGPTEATVGCSCETFQFTDLSNYDAVVDIYIGKPILNTQLLVLGSEKGMVPKGVTGELYIGGAGLARGYLNNPQITDERFIDNPYFDDNQVNSSRRLYRTGDLVRYSFSGNLEFVGRVDEQVKIRGFRIELGEIESLLRQNESIEQALVVTQGAEQKDKRLVAYFLPKTETLSKNDESGDSNRVENWQNVYDATYSHVDTPDSSAAYGGETDIAGWGCSYRDQLIDIKEMTEFVNGTVEIIKSLEPKKLLEVGVGTGMLLYRYAENCELVCATDLSSKALEKVSHGVTQKGWQHIKLSHGDALNLSAFRGIKFDTIVLNSVAQYFPSSNYFLKVLQEMSACVEEGGKILLGDLRNLDLLDAFLTSVTLYKAEGAISPENIRQAVTLAAQNEEELLISPSFFASLSEIFPEFGQVDIMVKQGSAMNEMMRYRYDVVLHKEPESNPAVEFWYPWLDIEDLTIRFNQNLHDYFGVTGFINQRISQDIFAVDELRSNPQANVQNLKNQILVGCWNELDQLKNHAEANGYELNVTWGQNETNQLDLIFIAKNASCRPCIKASEPYSLKNHFNAPQLKTLALQLIKQLKSQLELQLPDYMLPSSYVMVDEFPLTPNGKIDKKALPAPDAILLQGAYQAPVTEMEKGLVQIWAEILGLAPEKISTTANFFESGGNSLLLINLAYKLKNVFDVTIPMITIMESPTIKDLCSKIQIHLMDQNFNDLAACVVPLALSDNRDNLFCFHPLAGNVADYLELASHCSGLVSVYGVQPVHLFTDKKINSMQDMINIYAEEVKSVQGTGPYHLTGYSMGGRIAYEVACKLRAEGLEIGFLGVIDASPRNITSGSFIEQSWQEIIQEIISDFFPDFVFNWQNLDNMQQEEGLSILAENIKEAKLPLNVSEALIKPYLSYFVESGKLWEKHCSSRSDLDIYLSKTTRLDTSKSFALDWEKYTNGNIHIVDLQGTHNDVFDSSYSLANTLIIREQILNSKKITNRD